MERGKRQEWRDRGDDQHLSSGGDSDVTAELNVSLGMAAAMDCSSISSSALNSGSIELQLCMAAPTMISSPVSEALPETISCFSVCNYEQDGVNSKDWLDLSLGRKACDVNACLSRTSPLPGTRHHRFCEEDDELLALKLSSSSATARVSGHGRALHMLARKCGMDDAKKDEISYVSSLEIRQSSIFSTPESLDDFGSILELGSAAAGQEERSSTSKKSFLRISDRRPPFRSGFWFSLHPASTTATDSKTSSHRDPSVMQAFDKPYIRLRSGDIRVATVKKYMLAKLGVSTKAAKVVELTCRGEILDEESTLKKIRDEVWLPQASPDEVVMMLFYKIHDNPP